jgi:hypothetical protein
MRSRPIPPTRVATSDQPLKHSRRQFAEWQRRRLPGRRWERLGLLGRQSLGNGEFFERIQTRARLSGPADGPAFRGLCSVSHGQSKNRVGLAASKVRAAST